MKGIFNRLKAYLIELALGETYSARRQSCPKNFLFPPQKVYLEIQFETEINIHF